MKIKFKFPIVRMPKINIHRFAPWLKETAQTWVKYFLELPDILRTMTRPVLKRRLIWLIFAFVITYFIVGFVSGVGIYSKVFPLNTAYARFIADLYPFPAEITGLRVVTIKDITSQEKIIYYFAEQSSGQLGNRLDVDKQVEQSLEELRMAQKVLAQYNQDVNNKDVDEIMQKIADENGGKSKVQDLLKTLYGINIKQFRAIVSEQIAKDKVSNEVLKNVKVAHILVSDENKVKDIKSKIDKKELSFADAVKNESQDTETKDNGGLIQVTKGNDYVNRDSGLEKAFLDTAYKLKKNKISDPVKTSYGWHIIQVQDIKGFVDSTYQEFIDSIKSKTLIWRLYRP